jgi:hypothetical protein
MTDIVEKRSGMKRQHLEHTLQSKVMKYLDHNGRPEFDWRAIPNGDLRHPLVAIRLRDEGVKPGTPDIVICMDQGRAGWLELKSKHGSLSPYQKGFAVKVMRLGHYWAMAKSMPEAVAILKAWNVLRPNAEAI